MGAGSALAAALGSVGEAAAAGSAVISGSKCRGSLGAQPSASTPTQKAKMAKGFVIATPDT